MANWPGPRPCPPASFTNLESGGEFRLVLSRPVPGRGNNPERSHHGCCWNAACYLDHDRATPSRYYKIDAPVWYGPVASWARCHTRPVVAARAVGFSIGPLPCAPATDLPNPGGGSSLPPEVGAGLFTAAPWRLAYRSSRKTAPTTRSKESGK